MSSRVVMLCLLCITLLLSLTACAPAIQTEEAQWADAITLGSTTSTSSTTKPSESTKSTGGSTTAAPGTTSTSAATPTSTTTAGHAGNTESTLGYVNASTLHVRSGPGSTYESIGGLQRGDAVTITGQSGDWYCIRFGDTEAYVSAKYISSTPVE